MILEFLYKFIHTVNFKNLDNPKSTLVEHAADLEVGASVLVVSFRLGANPLEMVDFILDFVGLDIAKDDARKMTTSSMVREKPPR